MLSASRAVIDPVKLIGQLRTEINGGEPIRMFSLQHLGIKTIWAARLINGAFREIGTYEQITGAMPLRDGAKAFRAAVKSRSEEHTSELQSLMRISYAVFCLKKKNKNKQDNRSQYHNNTHQTPR